MDGSAYLGGRARDVSCSTRRVHLWSVVATSNATPHATYAIPFIETEEILDACDHGLWQISTSAVEYVRSTGVGTLNPLSDEALNDPSLGGGATQSRRTEMKLRVRASDGATPRLFDIDLNQSVMVVARKICAALLVPPGAIDVNNQPTGAAAFARSGFVADSFVGLSFTRCEEAPGDNSDAILTTHLFVAAGLQGVATIPPFAREVTIYQAATIGNASVMWTQHYGNPAVASIEIGALPFIAGARKTQSEIVLPDAQFLRSDIDGAADRFYTLVWSIRP